MLLRQFDFEHTMRVSLHESGHAYVAQVLGCKVHAVDVAQLNGEVQFDPPRGLPQQGLRLIGVAGIASEMLGADELVDPRVLVRAAADNDWRLSAEDRRLCGAVDLDLAAQVLGILKANRTGIRRYALDRVADCRARLQAGARR